MAHESCPNLKQMARALEQFPEEYRSTFATDQLQMTIASRLTSGHLVFHCRLKNEDWRPVALDRSTLPWRQPWLFNGTFVTDTGYTSSIMNNIIADLVAWPEPFLLAPNEVIEGDIQLEQLPHQTMPTNPLPYGRESLLLWTYHLGTYGETLPPTPGRDDPPLIRQGTVKLIGVTFISSEVMSELARH
jgi:hypothetical protein